MRFTGLSVAMAGGVLGASFIGSLIASPVAGWVVERVAANRVAALGASLCAAGLILIGAWDPGAAARPSNSLWS